ncbi:hypothetical protein [Microterricola viridarii]|uniref:Uncharacterized protein n=1 Tax=Microterricola viridarii TaxID=412690 RepID=A0A0X8E241_9MICO|nr:hypothetical protein [Microterricola viridarii]AMB59005.1 hypothetical protein AWU67_09195 [Microterricola viridarii]
MLRSDDDAEGVAGGDIDGCRSQGEGAELLAVARLPDRNLGPAALGGRRRHPGERFQRAVARHPSHHILLGAVARQVHAFDEDEPAALVDVDARDRAERGVNRDGAVRGERPNRIGARRHTLAGEHRL